MIHIELENNVHTLNMLDDKMHYQYDLSELKEINKQLDVWSEVQQLKLNG